MKVFISVDIEGITNVTTWSETELNEPEHARAAKQMTAEMLAAVQGALDAGADEIVVRDSHDSARNLIPDDLPPQATLIRGWVDNPESMMAGIDETFDAAIMIGYHAGAGYGTNPLSHTMNTGNNYFKINGVQSAEFDMNTYVAAHYGVPVVFASGDEGLCEHAKKLVPAITTVGVKKGWGGATINISPRLACEKIREGVKAALANIDQCKLEAPAAFDVEISYKECSKALYASYYPGVRQLDPRTVAYTAKDALEMMTTRMFIL